jgi:23S rRNA (adenine2503-C2)-methyltransferase
MTLPNVDLAPATHWLERLPHEWEAQLGAWGEPRYRSAQVFQWIQKRGVFDPAKMTNLPKSLRARLAEEIGESPMHVHGGTRSADRTRKLLVRADDGRDVETVLIPQLTREEEGGPLVPGKVVTQCVSSQIGCAMGCVFCASGVAGLARHLSAAEILAQVHLGRAHLEGDEHLRNLVFMGMGEPLHNYDAVARALVLITHEDGIGLSTRRVTVSTSGLVPQIDRLGRDFDGRVMLAISLHAVTDARRSSIMPINRKHGLAELIQCLERYPMPKRRRITIEYTLIEGVNDDVRDADKLKQLLRSVPVKINLIPMNPIEQSELGAPTRRGVEAFRDRLRDLGMTCTIRHERGGSVDAACGQLALYGPDGEKAERTRRLPIAK